MGDRGQSRGGAGVGRGRSAGNSEGRESGLAFWRARWGWSGSAECNCALSGICVHPESGVG